MHHYKLLIGRCTKGRCVRCFGCSGISKEVGTWAESVISGLFLIFVFRSYQLPMFAVNKLHEKYLFSPRFRYAPKLHVNRFRTPDCFCFLQIWDLSDPTGKGYLDKTGFTVALKLIALAQTRQDLTITNLTMETPAPNLVKTIFFTSNNMHIVHIACTGI